MECPITEDCGCRGSWDSTYPCLCTDDYENVGFTCSQTCEGGDNPNACNGASEIADCQMCVDGFGAWLESMKAIDNEEECNTNWNNYCPYGSNWNAGCMCTTKIIFTCTEEDCEPAENPGDPPVCSSCECSMSVVGNMLCEDCDQDDSFFDTCAGTFTICYSPRQCDCASCTCPDCPVRTPF